MKEIDRSLQFLAVDVQIHKPKNTSIYLISSDMGTSKLVTEQHAQGMECG